MKMKTFLLPAALLSVLLVVAGCGKKQKANEPAEPAAAEETVDMSQYIPSLEIGAQAPDFEAPDVLGNPVKLSDYLGKYVVLDFWATWCKDCRAEIPDLKKLYDKYGPKDIAFLGVSFDTDIESLVDYGIEHEIPWMVVCNEIKWKENPISTAFDIHWIPTMFLIDPEGKIVGVTFHATDMDALLAMVLEN